MSTTPRDRNDRAGDAGSTSTRREHHGHHEHHEHHTDTHAMAEKGADDRHSLRSLLSELIDDATRLIRQELRLARTEAEEKVGQAKRGAIATVAGLLIAFVGVLVLIEAVVVALATVMEPWLASVIVGGGLLLIGFIAYRSGQAAMKPENLTPDRTMRSLKEDQEMVSRRV